ncbi:hypothetical protein H4R26_003297 [Coemansia thaxteri]|uniref:Uncharacterized protein n=1 Tax=Coemansia thaxteri TaxID=2663907 RepID=A0A9W8BID7_9FUNG|nr:hypothetical protein H4R26_003297 [Coemansia thaxteri]
MPGSSSSRDATHSQAPQSSRSFGLGIRRAKAATGNSIRRLFRHAGRAGSTEGQQMLEQQEEMGGGIRPTLAPIECSSSFGLHRSRSDLRAPSVRSSKSVRSIFSAARRITLRPSTLFRRHAPDPDPSPPSAAVLLAGPPASWAHDASSASDAGSPLRSPSPVQTPLPPLPVAAASEHSPPQMLGQWMRHATSIKAARAYDNAAAYAAYDDEHALESEHYDWQTTAPSEPGSVSATTTVAVVIASPIAAVSVSAASKSPMSFSSKSLGLSLLDFGYNEQAINDMIPGSPASQSSSRSSMPSASTSVASQSSLLSADLLTDAAEECHTNCKSDSLVFFDAGAVVLALGAPEPVIAAAIQAVNLALSSPFVVDGIDELLIELEAADAFSRLDRIEIDLVAELMPPLMPCPSADVLLLREIDELIGQLSHPRVASCIDSEPVSALALPASACELDICGLILGLGDVASAVTAAGTCCTQSADMPSVVNLEDIVRALGNANALLALPPSFLSTGYRLDPAALVLALGAAPTSLLPPVQYLDAHYAECGDARSIPQTPSLICDIVADLPALDVAELVLGLGQVVELKLSAISSLDVERVRKSSTQTLVDSPTGSPSRHYGYIRFPQFRVALHEFDTIERETPPAAMLQRPSSDMDVDEAIQDSCEQQDGTLNINRLIAALRIPPIVVNRTLLGPLRDMLFPRLC